MTTVCTKFVPHIGEFSLRPLQLSSDIAKVHEWVRIEYSKFWGLVGQSIEEVENVYREIVKHSYVCLGLFNGEPAFITEFYRPTEMLLGRYYDALPSDRGVHLLVGPQAKFVPDYSWHIFTMLMDLMLDDKDVQRIVAEPDVSNWNIHRFLERGGFECQKLVNLPDDPAQGIGAKTARLYFCSRAQYAAALERKGGSVPLTISPHEAKKLFNVGPREPVKLSLIQTASPAPSFPLAGANDGLAGIAGGLTHISRGVSAARDLRGPLPVGTPNEVFSKVAKALGPAFLRERGIGTDAALQQIASILLEHGIHLAHPHAAAHLQPPPLAVAVAADVLVSAENGSLDTYDSGPAGIAIEQWVIRSLAKLAGFEDHAGGVFTPGGSLSNLQALLLARDAMAHRLGVDVRKHGVAGLPRPIVLCSEHAHFSVHRACATLGLGEGTVVEVPVDSKHRMRPEALLSILHALGSSVTPVAIFATAGTTDFGSIDPLRALSNIARHFGAWFHVDAAYGFGALYSERLAEKLKGIELADSITVDLHKMGWQPAAASVLLVRDAKLFQPLERSVDYLNPPDDTRAGYDGLLGRSLQTTRRADAAKVAATFLAFGRQGLGAMVDACHDLARYAEKRIAEREDLELVAPATLTTVLFRYRGSSPNSMLDDLNAELRRSLLASGTALIGRTTVRIQGRGASTCLKFTLLNPNSTPDDIDRLIEAVVVCGRAREALLDARSVMPPREMVLEEAVGQ
ncbi:GNAT family N-acetyltransferase [Pendulispora brunnea]|uniref:GNAT family N-acetyltransferase n=1 Tax=Pendulispora brunnea TaxID=2905690 RepID=A0ABZ2JYR7_9BACT